MIYTAITGRYDKERTDVKVFCEYERFVSHVLNAKIYKILSHLFVEEEYSVWVDGNITVKVPEQQIIDEFLKDHDIAVFRHPYRQSIYQEAEEIRSLGLDCPATVDLQIIRHQGAEYLAELGVIVRRHTDEIKRLNERWWAEICRYSLRDQLSFPYVFPKEKVNLIEGDARNHPYFKYEKHLKKQTYKDMQTISRFRALINSMETDVAWFPEVFSRLTEFLGCPRGRVLLFLRLLPRWMKRFDNATKLARNN